MHEYWRHIIRDRLERRRYTVTQEHPVGERLAVDLHATKDNQQVFVEIETGKSDIPANITKCRDLPGTVVFFFVTRELREQYRQQLPDDGLALTPWDLDQLPR